MLNMSQVLTIREKHCNGESVSEIAKALNIDRKTVVRYISQEDFSPKPPIKQSRPSKLDPYREIIESWLSEDSIGFKKQRHTDRRIQERLKDECGFECPYATISDYVRKNNLRKANTTRISLDLFWDPGIAQADFGQADFIISGTRLRCHYLVLSFPYSNIGYTQVFLGEAGECICQGLKDIFTHIGKVPTMIIFDNATGIGKLKSRVFCESELFSLFKAHYRFKTRYCNPASGWEKGNCERKVSFLRNQLFVPVPKLEDLKAYNAGLLKRCSFQESQTHYAKGISQGTLFESDFKAMAELPSKPFEAVRYELLVADGYGHVTVDTNHLYSSVPAAAGKELIVGIGAYKVTVLDLAGEVLAEHNRQFSKQRTENIDPASQLGLLAKRPRGWRNSRIRSQIPESVVAHLDAQDADGLRRDLRLLHESCQRSGLSATLDALDILASEYAGFPDFFQVGVLAARIADLGLDALPVGGADLSCYDEIFLGGVQDAR